MLLGSIYISLTKMMTFYEGEKIYYTQKIFLYSC